MKGSKKANLIKFLIIHTIAFTTHIAFCNLINKNTGLYQLKNIANDSFNTSTKHLQQSLKNNSNTTKGKITKNTTNKKMED